MDSIYTTSCGTTTEVVSLGDTASVIKDINVTVAEDIDITDGLILNKNTPHVQKSEAKLLALIHALN